MKKECRERQGKEEAAVDGSRERGKERTPCSWTLTFLSSPDS
jgi:hypothetical protein